MMTFAFNEQCKFQTTTEFILKTALFASEEEGIWQPKGSTLRNLWRFLTTTLYLTQGTVRIAKELCNLNRNCITFVQKRNCLLCQWLAYGMVQI